MKQSLFTLFVFLLFNTICRSQQPGNTTITAFDSSLRKEGLSGYLQVREIDQNKNLYFLNLRLLSPDEQQADSLWGYLSSRFTSTTGSGLIHTLFFRWTSLAGLHPDSTGIRIYSPRGLLLARIYLGDNLQLRHERLHTLACTTISFHVGELKPAYTISIAQADKKHIYKRIIDFSKRYYTQKQGAFSVTNSGRTGELEFEVCGARACIIEYDNTFCDLLKFMHLGECNLTAKEMIRCKIELVDTNGKYDLKINMWGKYTPAYGGACSWTAYKAMENTVYSEKLDRHLNMFKNELEKMLLNP